MLLINWLELQPLLADLEVLNERLQETLPVRKVCQFMAEITLLGYPWSGRSDLIPCYHPSRTYKPGQWIALPVPAPEESRPMVWQVAQVKSAEMTGNPVQGRFQALTLDVLGKEVRRAGGIPEASCVQPELSTFTSEELVRLGEWVADTYVGPMLATLRKLIQKGRVFGQIVGDTYLPEQMFTLPQERLQPFFERLSSVRRWLSLEEILQELPDLSTLKREPALALLRATLKASPYRCLGGDRWTTAGLFDQLDRDVPHGLPASHLRSKETIWTKQDQRDLADYRGRPMRIETTGSLYGEKTEEIRSEPDSSTGQPSNGTFRLAALNYHHITQAYFPVDDVLPVFPPDARMVFVQFIEGGYQPFILDQENDQLKAVHPDALRTAILKEGIPAGTYLWLEQQGDDKYRIFPRQLSIPRRVPGKLARLEKSALRIEHAQVQVEYEGDPWIFQADLSSEDIETLFAEARRADLSLRDALAEAIQKLCAADPANRAHRSDILNAVFLMRACSPEAVSILLDNQTCFEQLEAGYFRYRPEPDRASIRIRRQIHLARLWEDLISYGVPPEPEAGKGLSEDCGEVENSSSVERLEAQLTPASLPYDRWEQDLETQSHRREALDRKDSSAPPGKTATALNPASLENLKQPGNPPAVMIDTRRVAYGLKIPARPLHKRPIYQRVLFCLRGWLTMSFGSTHDQTSR